MRLPLINPYPMQQPPHDPWTAQLAAIAGELLADPITICSPAQHVAHAISGDHGGNLLPRMLADRLASLAAYRDGNRLMPPLRDVPAIAKYRVEQKTSDLVAVDEELEAYGLPLTPGQVVFHGGPWPTAASTLTTNIPLSTTLCAEVAKAHSYYHSDHAVWVITAAPNSSAKCYLFRNARNQTHGHETEILIKAGSTLHLGFTIRSEAHSIHHIELL